MEESLGSRLTISPIFLWQLCFNSNTSTVKKKVNQASLPLKHQVTKQATVTLTIAFTGNIFLGIKQFYSFENINILLAFMKILEFKIKYVYNIL